MRFSASTTAIGLLALARCAPAAPAPVVAPLSIDVSAPAPNASAVRVLPTTAPPPSAEKRTPIPDEEKVLVTVITPGAGPEAKAGDRLLVNYVGTLLDGTEFDSSLRAGRQPFKFTLGNGTVIKGWEQGLVGMQVGEKRKIVIPPSLAYGERGRPPTIPAAAPLVFEVELLAINPP
jgi:FKBP-type peptidyl-prolyl cis-trans isomerase